MRFISYIHNEKQMIGVLHADGRRIFPISSVITQPVVTSIATMIDTFRDADYDRLREAVARGDGLFHPIEEVRILAPIDKPRHDILCVGVNYKDHAEESVKALGDTTLAAPKAPVLFAKRANYILGSSDTLYPDFAIDSEVDYEAELAVIIGKGGINIKKEDAAGHIFGFSVFNDLSSRKLQRDHVQWFHGKSLDGYTAMGPMIVTPDELDLAAGLTISSTVNGEERQHSNTKAFIHDIGEVIAAFSQGMTLLPGDIIATGTPAGVGMGFTPPRYLKSGDSVSCTIEGIGTLTTHIR